MAHLPRAADALAGLIFTQGEPSSASGDRGKAMLVKGDTL
jgi:hypothetical protein